MKKIDTVTNIQMLSSIMLKMAYLHVWWGNYYPKTRYWLWAYNWVIGGDFTWKHMSMTGQLVCSSSILSAQNSSTLFLMFSFSCRQSFCHTLSSWISGRFLTKNPLQCDWITNAASSSVHISDSGSGGLGLKK